MVDAGIAFSSVNACVKLAEYGRQLAEVGTENEVFIRTILVVKQDLDEVERLICVDSVKIKLIGTPGKTDWVKGGINNARSVLDEIGKLVEQPRVEKQSTNGITFVTRAKWVFDKYPKIRNRQVELSACHRQLSNILNYLVPLEEPTISQSPPLFYDATSYDDILSPRQRMRERFKAGKAQSYTASTTDPNRPWLPDRSESSPAISHTRGLPHTTPTLLTANMVHYKHQSLPIAAHSDFNPVFYPPNPPPTYTTAIQGQSVNSTRRKSFQEYESDIGSEYTAGEAYSSSRDSLTHNTFNNGQGIHGYKSCSDLAAQFDGSWSLSGTNHSGPVDPLGYAELRGSLEPSPSEKRPRTASGPVPTFSYTHDILLPCDRTMSDPASLGRNPDSSAMVKRMKSQKEYMKLLETL